MAKKIFNFGERLALYEDLPANTQYNTMPEPNIENINNIIQYTGDTNQNYTNGYYYKCVSDGQEPATYSWQRVDVQPGGDLSNYVEAIQLPITLLSLQPGMSSAEIVECLGGQSNVDKLLDAFDNHKPIFGVSVMTGPYSPGDYIQIPVSIKWIDMSGDGDWAYFNAIVSGESWDIVIRCDHLIWSVISVTQTPLNPQFNSLPAADVEHVGQIIQYTGTTTGNYITGYFYICVSNGGNPETYSWEQVDVQTQGTPFYLGSVSDYTSQNPLDISVLEPGLYCIGVNTWNDVLYVNGNVNGVPLTGTLSVAAGNSSFNNYIAYLQLTQKINTCTPTTSGVNVGKVYINATYAGQETVAYHTKSLQVIINSAGTACTIDNSSSSVFTLKVVTQNDNQTITGRKTFSTLPETSIAPTENYHMVNKKYVDDAIVAAVAEIDITSREIVQTLPTQDISTKTIYMVPSSTPGTQNVYNEYMYINNAWELIGSTAIDLSNYYTKTEVDTMISNINSQIGDIASVLAQLVNTVVPMNTVLYTQSVSVDGNSGTYKVKAIEHHIDTDYYVLEYSFMNTSSNTIEGLMLNEIYDDGENPVQYIPLLWTYDIEPGETVVLTSYWQNAATYAASLDKYDNTQNITVEVGEVNDASTFTQDLPLSNLGFTTDVVAHTTAYNSNDVTGGFTCTTFDRTGGSEDPYTVPEEFRVVWINQNNQTFGTLSEPVNGSLTMTRSYHGFDAAQFDSTNTKFFLAKTADIVNCTYQEFLDAYNAFINGGV